MGLDPTTLAVVRGALERVAAEMDSTLVRSAFSPVISEGQDRASGIYHPTTGEVIVQGEEGLPNFVGAMQFTVQALVGRMSGEEMRPGDIFIVNDPYVGGTHLMDVKLIAPYFHRGEHFAYLANTGHWIDIGGRNPGGYVIDATEYYQEGIRIPPVRLFGEGKLDRSLFDLIMSNLRLPGEVYGDMMAQVNALHVGRERLDEVLDKYGAEVVEECITALREYSERLMRDHIRAIPDGDYSCVDYMDSDGIEHEPLKMALRVKVEGDELLFDFSGTSPACRGPLNIAAGCTKTACYVAIKHLFPEVPINSGCFAPIRFHLPEGCFLNAKPPSPCCGFVETTHRVNDLIFGALSAAIPERVFAAAFSTSNNLTVSGVDRQEGRWVIYTFLGGGYGGGRAHDGLTHGSTLSSVAKTLPIEVIEHRFPLLFRRYALRENSAGPGWRRGGFGAIYEVEVLRGEAEVTVMGDRGRFAPFGILGGREAKKNRVTFLKKSGPLVPPHLTKASGIRLEAGEAVLLESPGGGGYGDPLQREPSRVLEDVRKEYISIEDAERDYGVVIRTDPLAVDEKETVERRKALAAARKSSQRQERG